MYILFCVVCVVIVLVFSRQLAEEVLKAPPATGEDEDLDEGSGFEGMEVLAKAIETGMLH